MKFHKEKKKKIAEITRTIVDELLLDLQRVKHLEFEIKVETLSSKCCAIVKLRGLIELICTGLWNATQRTRKGNQNCECDKKGAIFSRELRELQCVN